MSVFDIDSVINGTDEKVILNRYKAMKENYNDTTAKEFYEAYNDKPLSTILNASRMIFSEPMYGYDFYKEAVANTKYCQFLALESERDKIEKYIQENSDKLPDSQKSMYDTLLETVNNLIDGTKHVRVIAEALEDKYPGINSELADAVYEYNEEKFADAAHSFDQDGSVYATIIEAYSPYIATGENAYFLRNIAMKFMDKMYHITEADEDFRPFAAAIVAGNKAKLDTLYQESVNCAYGDVRYIIDRMANLNLAEVYKDSISVVEESVHHGTISDAIESLYIDMVEDAEYETLYEIEREHSGHLLGILSEATMFILEHDYGDTYDKSAYSLFSEENYTYEEAVMKAGEGADFFVEAESQNNEDEDDFDLDEFDDDGNEVSKKDTPKPDVKKDSDKKSDSSDNTNSPQIKDKKDQVKAVEQKRDLATRIQNKAMDMEVKQQKLMGKAKHNATKLGNAAKAVTRIPKNISDSIKEIGRKIDAADDERRKQYMTEPGFRKKVFRNLKLSLMYTTALSARLSLLPVLLVARHASKQKDRRIRNECHRELLTEIKICDEKINDANAAGDNAEKYRLMRIRDQLEAEAIRVRANSTAI